MTEFSKLFQELPGLLEAGKILRNAATPRKKPTYISRPLPRVFYNFKLFQTVVESGFSNPDFKTREDPTKADSHRPISLLPILSKIAEKIIQTRLNQHLSENDILISQQHAFRANLSTSHQLLHAVEYIKTGFANKKSTGAVFLDVEKAFDRVCTW
ncbi:RNA-directed DNA polymerase from mobile element jockey [Trichonephila clavipes]|nr:RNA-directed DNA polymerase from mobile element jockey [Trichonephila clavipes]